MPGRTVRRLGVAGGVAAGIAGAAWAGEKALVSRARRRPDPDSERSFAIRAEEIQSFPSSDGGTVAVASRGDGPAIVLSHGVALSMQVWAHQFETLPELGFRVVAFDHRGHGESRLGDAGHSIDNLADDIRSVLDHLELRDAILVGHSMGGVAVQAYAIRHPDHATARVRGLVLLSTLAKSRIGGGRRLRAVLDRVSARVPDLGWLLDRPDVGFLVARVGFGRDPQPSHVELTRRLIAACPAETARDASRALLGLDLTSKLPDVTLPTMVISGTADVLTPPADARRIASLIPGARLELVPGAGHMIMLERAARFDQLVTDFAREVGVAPGAAA